MLEAAIGASGKGLDHANWDDLPFIRVGINTAASKIPGCLYISSVDLNVIRIPYLLDKKILLTTEETMRLVKKNNINTVSHIIIRNLKYSMLLAIQFCINIGVSKIYFIGCDFGQTRHEDLKKHYKMPSEFYINQYSKIKEMMLCLMELNRINYDFI